jgi:beta-aspartyl-peptidase (threonine type)
MGVDRGKPVLVVHAGAGVLSPDLGERTAETGAFLIDVLDRGRSMLEGGDDAVAVAVCAVSMMESFELFNAGHGAALCSDGTVELSAAVMRGSDCAAGAVAGVRSAKHPIRAALSLLDEYQVLMVGESADQHAVRAGVEPCPNEFFVTARQRARLEAGAGGDRGTVGAVCLDRRGSLAAATSTGGVRGQPPGRVGDSPLIGAGTWADGNVAVSCTGDGEAFIRTGAARYIAALIGEGKDLQSASDAALRGVAALGGRGGLIAVSATGEVATPFTTEVMPRAIWKVGEPPRVTVGTP